MAITISGENNNDRILASDGVIDQISGINIVGLITASHINVGSNINLGNAGIITATTFVGNLTGNVNSTSPLLLQTGGSERFRITSDNALGIAGANYGSSGQVLTSGGSGSAVSWTTITGTTINNNANNRIITGSGTANTLEAETSLEWDGTNTLTVVHPSSYQDFIVRTSAGGGSFELFRAGNGPFRIRSASTSPSSDADELVIGATNATRGLTIFGATNNIFFGDDSDNDIGKIQYVHSDNSMRFTTNTNEALRIDSGGRILKGLTTARGNYGNNASGVEYGFQIEGTSAIAAGLSIVRNSNDANDGGIVLGKTRATSNGGNTVVQAGDDLGNLTFAGNDGSTMLFGAEIFAEVQSGVGNDDMPADLIFKTNGGSTSTTERLRISSGGDYLFLGGTLRIKNSANNAQYGAIYGDSTSFHVNAGGNLKLYSGGGERVRFSNDGQISIQGTNTAFDTTGQLNSLQLYYEQDSGQASIGPYSSGGNTHLSFYTNAGGAAATEKLRITGGGQVNIGDNLTQTTYPFHIQGSTNTTASIKCSGNDTANFFFDSNRSGASSNIGLLRGLWNGTSVADIRFLTGVDTSNKDDGKIAFLTASAGTPSFRMIIDQEGTTHFSDNDVRTDIADVVNVKLYNPARFVARNGKHVERGFYSMSTGSGSVDYAHMKTDMATNSSTMFLFTCRGYSYGSGKVMFAQTCGYCYSSTNNIINKENRSWDGQTVLSTYKSSDGYVAIQVDFGSNSSYYTGFVIDVQYANHAMGAMNYKVISATFNSNNNHFS